MCPGEQLNLTCCTDVTALVWILRIPGVTPPERRIISSEANTDEEPTYSFNQTMFRFLRTSTSPLMSVMIINNFKLKGMRVDCSDVSTTVVNLFRNGILLVLYNYCTCLHHTVGPRYAYIIIL